jgi:serine protease Do
MNNNTNNENGNSELFTGGFNPNNGNNNRSEPLNDPTVLPNIAPNYYPLNGYQTQGNPNLNGFNNQEFQMSQIYNRPEQPQKPQRVPVKQQKKRGGARNVIALLLAVIALGGGGGYAGYYFTKPPKEVPKTSSSVDSADNNGNETADNGEAVSATTPPKFASTSPTAPTEPLSNNGTELTAKEIYKKVSPAIVEILVYGQSSSRYGQSSEQLTGSASGVVITEDGYIVTNHHVVSSILKTNGSVDGRIVIRVDDKDNPNAAAKEYEATLLGADEGSDLAVLKINAKDLIAATLGSSAQLVPGDTAYAIGYPMDAGKSITKGIVSGLQRDVDGDSSYALPAIQTDVAINPGNSGGALINGYGEVVGIVNMKYVYSSIEGMGFAISIDEAKTVIDDLIERGAVTTRPALGISAIALNSTNAPAFGLDITAGLLVTNITKSAPISKSELAVGDIITEVNGTGVYSAEDLQTALKSLKAGDKVTLTIIRIGDDGKQGEYKFDVTLTTAQ